MRNVAPRPIRRTSLAALKRKLDKLWSKIVRERDKVCMVRYNKIVESKCYDKGPHHADHLFGQKKLRWEPAAGARVCMGHHQFITFDQAAHAMLGMAMLGEDYQTLLRSANNDRGRHTYSRPELEEKLLVLAQWREFKGWR